MKFRYERMYEQWLQGNSDNEFVERMRPTVRQIAVCLPNGLWRALDQLKESGEDPTLILDSIIGDKMTGVYYEMYKAITKKTGGKSNG